MKCVKEELLSFLVLAVFSACIIGLIRISDLCNSKTNFKHLLNVSCKVNVSAGNGSGVIITRKVGQSNRTFVWTAGHVADAARNEDGTFDILVIEQGRCKVDAEVIAYSESEDLALLEIVQNDWGLESTVFYQSNKAIEPGTELVHVGSVLGLANAVSTGVMSRINHKYDGEDEIFDQTSVMGYPGSSGGGVFLRDGQCIGLLTRGAGPGLNFIVPIRRMRAWARSENIEWALDPSLPIPVEVKRPIDR